MSEAATPSAQQRFLSLFKRDILKLELAELDFGIYRILNYRRTQILSYQDETLPDSITAWTKVLAQAGGKQLAESEADNCYYHPSWSFSVPICGYVLRANSEVEIGKIQPGFLWSQAPSVLLHQDSAGAYVGRMLENLLARLPGAM